MTAPATRPATPISNQQPTAPYRSYRFYRSAAPSAGRWAGGTGSSSVAPDGLRSEPGDASGAPSAVLSNHLVDETFDRTIIVIDLGRKGVERKVW